MEISRSARHSSSGLFAQARMQDIIVLQCFDLRLADGDDGDGAANRVEDLQFVARFLTTGAARQFHRDAGR